MPLTELPALLGVAGWCVAGGVSVELHVGRTLRTHGDIDVVVLRPNLDALRGRLAGWDLWCADPPGTLRRWPATEPLPDGVHDVWCRPTAVSPWRLQLLVDDVADGLWVCRRDVQVRLPLECQRSSKSGPVALFEN